MKGTTLRDEVMSTVDVLDEARSLRARRIHGGHSEFAESSAVPACR
jgi:hypothetical protein